MTVSLISARRQRLTELAPGSRALVVQVDRRGDNDLVADRLEDLGFVAGEPLRVVAVGPFGGDPLVVQVGYTRFALRRSEADRILVVNDGGATP